MMRRVKRKYKSSGPASPLTSAIKDLFEVEFESAHQSAGLPLLEMAINKMWGKTAKRACR
jgi:hypothetical protein